MRTCVCGRIWSSRERDRIGDDQAGEIGGFEAFDGRAAEDGVRGGDVDFLDAVFVEHFGGAGDRAGGADHVVEHQGDFAFDLAAEDVGLDGGVGAHAAFVDDRDRAADAFGVAEGALDAALVGADDDDVGQVDARMQEVLVEHRGGVQVVDRHVEEALNLSGVQVHRRARGSRRRG